MFSIRKPDQKILKLTFPIFIELVLQILVGNADQIMVGWRDPNGVGAIGNANQITNLVLIVFSVICIASTVLIAQYLGAGDTHALGSLYTVSVLVNLVAGVLVSLLLLFGAGPIFTLMQVKQEFFDQACLYLRIVGGGMCLQALFLTFTAFFRSNQMMMESMVVSVVVNVLNLAGNALLINGAFGLPALGVAGAAISSVVSRAVGLVVIAILFVRRLGPMISLRFLRPFPRDPFRRLMHLGIPSSGESLSYNLSQVVVQTFCNGFTAYMVNARVYANLFAMISYLFASAIAQAAQVLVANLLGAGDADGADRRVKSTLLSAVTVSGAVSLLLFLLSRPLYGLFTQDGDILSLCSTIMLVEIPLELGRAVNLVMGRALQSAGDIRFPILIGVTGTWLVAIGGAYLLGRVLGLGLVGVWIAMACDECLRAGLFLLRWRQGAWKTKRLI